ncbi:hypothetical protein QBC34DRAFT_413505 [Podospora aff. communis PSN243]|uniref:Uncharacterized protein n=1 Tax=Podospora aff. communis PSN243 TaxID=3040156 RepID=A0AAV9GA43_9PEZI|nr:hypothetical protein QBC34DRAFT_413505 [Podospora aff. communis PSN243]
MAGSISPKPSFYLCPDFSVPPDGHLQLGSVLRGLDLDGVLTPLNLGHLVDVAPDQLWPRDKPQEKTGFSRSLRELRSIEGSLWAKLFAGSSGSFSFLRRRDDDETLTVDKLLVRFFIPTQAYVKQALEADGVASHVRITKQEKPVYLVTGLMWVEGASLSKTSSRQNKLGAQGGATDPNTGTTAGGSASYEGDNSVGASFDGSTPFVLGIRVRKIWWEKGVRHDELDAVGATLGGNRGRMDMLDGLQYLDDEEVDGGPTGQTFVANLGESGSALDM